MQNIRKTHDLDHPIRRPGAAGDVAGSQARELARDRKVRYGYLLIYSCELFRQAQLGAVGSIQFVSNIAFFALCIFFSKIGAISRYGSKI